MSKKTLGVGKHAELEIQPSTFSRMAQRYLVGGVNSPVRAFLQTQEAPVMAMRARGARLTDVTGTAYRDFMMGWGALILGHNPPIVTRAVRQALARGALFGLTHPAEIELAQWVVREMPSIEQVRFTVSGTEACLTAIKLARAITGRAKLLTFAGCYHGHGETAIARTSAGIPPSIAQDVLQVPFNDATACEALIARERSRLAAVIVEPAAANMGVVAPATDFLPSVRRLTQRAGALLIFDEVVTGFRLGGGGAQGYFKVRPDLTVLGKILGGGLPIGAVGGAASLMSRLAPVGAVYHGGTFAGHPLSMAAGVATLHELSRRPPYPRLERLAHRLAQGVKRQADDAGVPIRINRVGSMLTVFFSSTSVTNFAAASASRRDRFAQWAQALRRQRILVPPSPYEALFLSTAHTEDDVEQFIDASRIAFRSLRGDR